MRRTAGVGELKDGRQFEIAGQRVEAL